MNIMGNESKKTETSNECQFPGVQRIAAERERQVKEEHWTAEHDDSHTAGQLAMAACCYASWRQLFVKEYRLNGFLFKDPWPWESVPGNIFHKDEIRRLEIAGALIAAEIDRLLRLQKK